jgi:hypothetical protein
MQTFGNAISTNWLNFTWNADYSVNYFGYKIDALKFYCRPSQSEPGPPLEISQNYPYLGYLMGEGDVIYVKVKQPEGKHLGIPVWPLNETLNPSLYVSLSAQHPGPSNYDYKSEHVQSRPEMVIVPPFGNPGGDGERWVYIALVSDSTYPAEAAHGGFRLYGNVHAVHSSYTVSTDWTPNSDQSHLMHSLLRNLSKAVYLATDGRHYVHEWQMRFGHNDGFIRFYEQWASPAFTDRFMRPAPMLT